MRLGRAFFFFLPLSAESQAAQIMGLHRSSSSITKLPTIVAACQPQRGQENMCLLRANHKEQAENCFRLGKKKKKRGAFCRFVDQSTMYFRGLRKVNRNKIYHCCTRAQEVFLFTLPQVLCCRLALLLLPDVVMHCFPSINDEARGSFFPAVGSPALQLYLVGL